MHFIPKQQSGRSWGIYDPTGETELASSNALKAKLTSGKPRRPSSRTGFKGRGRTCAQQVLQGVGVLQEAAGVQPGLQAVTIAVVAFRVIVELLQAAVATELHVERLSVPRGAVRIVDPGFRKVPHA